MPPRTRFASFFLLDGRQRYPALDGIRGYAVLLVLIVHAVGAYLLARGLDDFTVRFDPVWSSKFDATSAERVLIYLSNLHYAVDLFFVLSAFLMTRVVLKQNEAFAYGRYVRGRLMRIYPPVLVTLVLAIGVQVFWLQKMTLNGKDVVKNLLFLHGAPNNVFRTAAYNFPTWSLFYEGAFYLLLPFICVRMRRPGNASAGLMVVAMLLLSQALAPRAGTFAFGVLLGLQDDGSLSRLACRLKTWVVVGAYLALTSVFAAGATDWAWFTPLFGVAASLMVVKAGFDNGPLHRFFAHPLIRWCGSISFSVYLCHFTVIEAVQHWLRPGSWTMHPLLAAGLFTVVAIAASLLTGTVLFAIVERWYFVGRRSASPAVSSEVLPARMAA